MKKTKEEGMGEEDEEERKKRRRRRIESITI